MTTTQRGIELIKRHEGCRLSAYRCAAGIWTIGYGHTGTGVQQGQRITAAQAETLLRADLATADDAVNAAGTFWKQNQFDALVSFTFNVGVGAFKNSTLLRIARANPADVQIRCEFTKWVHANGAVLQGLVKRRMDEANLYFS